MTDVTVRAATQADREFLLALVPRLRAFGPTELRPPESLDEAERRALAAALDEPTDEATVLVAHHHALGLSGAAYAMTLTDYFTGERHGHLSIIMVTEEAEGRGVGPALMRAVEDWSRDRGHRFLTLWVFDENSRARAFYEKGGFAPDMIRYAKLL